MCGKLLRLCKHHFYFPCCWLYYNIISVCFQHLRLFLVCVIVHYSPARVLARNKFLTTFLCNWEFLLISNLYPFESETSLNAWYFWRQEPPFLLPECLFLRNQILVSAHFKRMQRHLCLVSVKCFRKWRKICFHLFILPIGNFLRQIGNF